MQGSFVDEVLKRTFVEMIPYASGKKHDLHHDGDERKVCSNGPLSFDHCHGVVVVVVVFIHGSVPIRDMPDVAIEPPKMPSRLGSFAPLSAL